MAKFKCRYPAGHGDIIAHYFDEYLGREAARDMERSGQQAGDREREHAGLRFARGHERALEELRDRMTDGEKRIAQRAVRCYAAGGRVIWGRVR